MSHYDYDLGILGGGAAGLTAAAGAARFGARTILIEKSPRLGGNYLHVGCVPSKTLIRTAGVWALAARAPQFGLPRLELPPVDLAAVMDRVRAVIAEIQRHDSPERFCELGAEVRFGRAAFVDAHTVELEGRRIGARSWIVATGSRPALPPVAGLDEVGCWTNANVFEQNELPARLIVLGGGPIGLELAQAFARLGSRVTVVEFMDQILGPEDADLAGILETRLLAEGVEILTGTKALHARRRNGLVELSVGPAAEDNPAGGDRSVGGDRPAAEDNPAGTDWSAAGGNRPPADETTCGGAGAGRVITAEAILVAAGRLPNTEDLGLEAAGVEFTPRGITANARLKTNIPHIYACGDVNGQLPFTHVAGYEGGIALTNAVLRLPRKADYTAIGWCTYTDPEIASIGYNEKRARKEGLEYHLIQEHFSANDRALAEGEPLGKIKLLVSPGGKLLGCQIIGAHAGELIHEWVLALAAGTRLTTLAGAVHIYPTMSEISKRVAGELFASKLFSERTRAVLHLLFNLKGRACNPHDT